MILIFGGTTEGRLAAKVCEAAGKSFYYSSKNGDQQLTSGKLTHLHGGMDAEAITQCCQEKCISLIINAAHPFATLLHHNIAEAAHALGLACIRLERTSLSLEGEGLHPVKNMEEAMAMMTPKRRILALTGVKSAPSLRPYMQQQQIWLRIMDRADSHRQIEAAGFPRSNLLYYKEGEENAERLKQLIHQHGITAIICKESGQSGGLQDKIEAAQSCACPLAIIRRPQLPCFEYTVYGEHGLRRAIQKLLPDYFPLKTGLTTGSYATAASCAALHALIHQAAPATLSITLPDGERLNIEPAACSFSPNTAEARFIKDSGDDPCVIHGLELGARVRRLAKAQGIIIKGGEGVGHATLPGLDFPVGAAAINKVPRAMMLRNLQNIMQEKGYDEGLEVEIFIIGGEEAATKTLNSRLGIIGGLSILGTSGIVHPFSAEAFLASIERQIEIVQALGHRSIALNSGAKSELAIRQYLPELEPICFLHFGNLIGDSLAICQKAGIEYLHLGLMIGKAVKLAQGELDTHNKQCRMDKKALVELAKECHCCPETLQSISNIHSARELWGIIPSGEEEFFHRLAKRCHESASRTFPSQRLRILLIAEGGQRIIPFPQQNHHL